MELSVALVLFFFFFLAASGMLTGWLFSFSVSKKDNLLTTTSGHTLKFLLEHCCIHVKIQSLQSCFTCWTLIKVLSVLRNNPIFLNCSAAVPHSQGVPLLSERRPYGGERGRKSARIATVIRGRYIRESTRRHT